MSNPVTALPKSDEQRKLEGRRAALKTLGVVGAYAAPVLLATSIPTKAARASGSAGGSAGGGGASFDGGIVFTGNPIPSGETQFEFSGMPGYPANVTVSTMNSGTTTMAGGFNGMNNMNQPDMSGLIKSSPLY